MTNSDFHLYRPHPWHGLEAGPNVPAVVTAYIELTPFDYMKYEIDKKSGYVKVDRPQKTSAQPPCLYGLIPQTYCGAKIASLSPKSSHGDGDPLDICVFSERPITRAEIIMDVRVLGGLQMVDDGEADDKIIAVIDNDPGFAGVTDISQIPHLVDRLEHYMLTYKLKPGKPNSIEITSHFGAEYAHKVILASMEDYNDKFGKK
ncbi:MAG TPA: inorganic pyrophosphatase [Anaerolineales bacterium]|nr:inorganic pyrophosphatase [Anaerolineales bacterium]